VSPHDASDAQDWDGHLLLLYRNDHERLSWLAEWMRHGLRLGEKILYVEPADAGPDSVAVRLREHGADTDALLADHRLEILSPQAYYPVGGPEAAISRALLEGFPAVRVSGAAASALAVVSEAGHRDIEWGVDRLCRGWPVSALCQYAYPAGRTDVLRATLDMHPSGFRERWLAASSTRSTVVLHGSVNEVNVEVLVGLVDTATDRAAATGGGRLRIDLTDLADLATGACTAFAGASEQFRGSGGNLVLDGARPAVEQVLRTAGLAELPGVELVTAAP
jgi:anti-anti-sigma regulatory factor